MSDDFNIVDALLENEKPKSDEKAIKTKPKVAGKSSGMIPVGDGNIASAFDKATNQLNESLLNKGYDPLNPGGPHWSGDCRLIPNDVVKELRMPPKAYVILAQTPTYNREAAVYSPFYNIWGWGASSDAAFDNCITNIRNHLKKVGKDKAKEVADKYWATRKERGLKHPFENVEA